MDRETKRRFDDIAFSRRISLEWLPGPRQCSALVLRWQMLVEQLIKSLPHFRPTHDLLFGVLGGGRAISRIESCPAVALSFELAYDKASLPRFSLSRLDSDLFRPSSLMGVIAYRHLLRNLLDPLDKRWTQVCAHGRPRGTSGPQVSARWMQSEGYAVIRPLAA
jgi:hypothetical protein